MTERQRVWKIVILEDNNDRQATMLACLRDRFPQYEAVFFDVSSDIIAYLREHLAEALIVCLDHDLELRTRSDGSIVDCGTGREVADFLATKTPSCPVLIHSTNDPAALGMQMVLEDSNWKVERISPFGDLEWIPTLWFRTLRNSIVRSVSGAAALPNAKRSS